MFDPERLLRMFRRGMRMLNGSHETFGSFFTLQGNMVMVMLALAGSLLVGNDLRYRSLGFYVAKPISHWHYIIGKMLAVAIVVHVVTTLPAVLMFFKYGSSDAAYLTDVDYFRDQPALSSPVTDSEVDDVGPASWPLLLGILGYGTLLSISLSIMLVAAASWMRRTVPLIMLWTTVFFFLRLVAAVLVRGLHYDPRWRLLDMWNNLRLLGFVCLRYPHERIGPGPQPSPWEAAIVLLVVCCLCLVYLHYRIRAVEVVR